MPISPQTLSEGSQSMVPMHIKITEEMHELLTEVAKKHGFRRIQGLIRYYIRCGLDAEDIDYRLSEDTAFLNKLKRQGVSEEILAAALSDNEGDTLPHNVNKKSATLQKNLAEDFDDDSL